MFELGLGLGCMRTAAVRHAGQVQGAERREGVGRGQQVALPSATAGEAARVRQPREPGQSGQRRRELRERRIFRVRSGRVRVRVRVRVRDRDRVRVRVRVRNCLGSTCSWSLVLILP